MTKQILLSFLFLLSLPLAAQEQSTSAIEDSCHEVLLQTSKGNILLRLYNETPLHRDNFMKLVRSGYYDGNLFHRVIADFMIQTGDSTTRHAKTGDRLGGYSPNYNIPAEFRFPKLFHKRGRWPQHANQTATIRKDHRAPLNSTLSGDSHIAMRTSINAKKVLINARTAP